MRLMFAQIRKEVSGQAGGAKKYKQEHGEQLQGQLDSGLNISPTEKEVLQKMGVDTAYFSGSQPSTLMAEAKKAAYRFTKEAEAMNPNKKETAEGGV